jgi:hypothetical protein
MAKNDGFPSVMFFPAQPGILFSGEFDEVAGFKEWGKARTICAPFLR